jgi:hypothetical protein
MVGGSGHDGGGGKSNIHPSNCSNNQYFLLNYCGCFHGFDALKTHEMNVNCHFSLQTSRKD